MVRRARERYARYKIDIVKTSPDFRPFVHHHHYAKPSRLTGEEDDQHDSEVQPMDLTYVRDVIKRSISWELPGHVPFAAMNALVLEFTGLWRSPSLSCFNDIFAMTNCAIHGLIQKHFGEFPNLAKFIWSLVHAELEQCKTSTQIAIDFLLQIECQPLLTQNTHCFEMEEKKWHNHFNDIYTRFPCYKCGHLCSTRPPCDRAKTGHADELLVMAQAQAYFCVAYRVCKHTLAILK
ncbi:hypothetical protein AX15_005805 [Amanita polypyramis BW_CC]|nr:hypothetical protein AX15_005805 [Amanita polypyramis BW_CC]